MRLRHALATGATVALLAVPSVVAGTALAAPTATAPGPTPPPVGGGGADTAGGADTIAVPERQPTCGNAADTAFPIGTRIKDGPTTYEAGGGFRTWRVELTNTTARTCGNIHPVIVFTDRAQTLQPSHIQLEFYEDERGPAEGGRPHPVTIEKTDHNELVGVLDNGFPGYTVPPGRTLTVPVRLAFTSAARPDEITANAAIVQRRGDDGDWVGESGDYRFAVRGEERPAGEATAEPTGPPPTGEAAEPGVAEELSKTGHDTFLVAGATALALLLGTGARWWVGRRDGGRRGVERRDGGRRGAGRS
ncbi:cell wall protein [Streptomyces sp. NPDC045431]|uniref:cell wall protein n=1 Tax=Streptomyces sp. NPDC045431 TaxID=3155613 RepID=UPI0033E5B5E5